jgi:hypothetical protein
MNLKFGLLSCEAQIVMELDTTERSEALTAKKILKMKPVIELQHFIAGTQTRDGVALIRHANKSNNCVIGDWKFHSSKGKIICEDYFRFTPLFEVKKLWIAIVDEDTDERYLIYGPISYKKL